MLKLRALDPGQRAVLNQPATGNRRGDELGIDLLAGERGFDQSLAPFDHLGAGFGRGGQAGEALAP